MLKFFPKLAVYVAIFSLPLFTLPFTANALDFPKQFLLLILVSAGFIFWLWPGISERKFSINLAPINFLILGWLAAIFISCVFSLYRYGSFWGWPLPVAESFAATIGFVLLYFLIANSFKKNELPGLVAVLGVSAAIAAVYGVLQSFGVYLTPFLPYAKDNPSFNTVGSVNSFLIFLAVVLAMILPLAFAAQKRLAIPMKICAAILFGALLLFNGALTVYLPSKAGAAGYDFVLTPWIVLAVGALAAVIFAASNQQFSKENRAVKNVSFAMFFCAVLLIIFNVFAKPIVAQISESANNFFNRQIGAEIALRHTVSMAVAVDTLKQSPREFLIGSGAGTFGYDYVKFKPKQITQDGAGWNKNFFVASSEIINRAATTGVLGLLLFLAIILAQMIEGFRTLMQEEKSSLLSLALFSGWIAIAVAGFLSSFNFVLAMLFWFLLAAGISQGKIFLFELNGVKKNYAILVIFAAISAATAVFVLQIVKNYYAEMEYLGAMKAFAQRDIATTIKKLEIAADITDRAQDNYLVNLAQAYLAQAEKEIEQKNDQDAQTAFDAAALHLREAVKNAAQSTEIANPNNSANWAMRARIYRKLIGVSEGFDIWALNMYQNAIKLEPTNPLLFNEVGQIHIIKNNFEKAKIAFEKAVEIMPQYIDARYYLALIADQQGNKSEAIRQLEMVWMLLPSDDLVSKENIANLIESLEKGGSISGQQQQQALQDSGLKEEGETLPYGGKNNNDISGDLEKVMREGETQFLSPKNSEVLKSKTEK